MQTFKTDFLIKSPEYFTLDFLLRTIIKGYLSTYLKFTIETMSMISENVPKFFKHKP